MSQAEIKSILDELYQIDQSFKQYEKQLIKIINQMLNNKPDTKFDENFRRELKLKLLQRAEELSKKKTTGFFYPILYFFTARRFAYFAAGTLIILLILIPIISKNQKTGSLISFIPTFERVGNAAFGDLQSGSSGSSNADATAPEAQGQPKGLGGGGGGSASGSASMIMPPYFVNYRYVYKGELKLDQNQVEVLKRLKGTASSQEINNLLGTLNFGLADLSSFSGAQADNLTFNQDQDFGYSIFISFTEGRINIYEYWPSWNQCFKNNCVINPLKITDLPTDSVLIDLADNFVREHNINLENYGQPQVQDLWRLAYQDSTAQADFYIPDSQTVVYPLIINNQPVYDDSGNPYGLSVNINVRQMKVSGVSEITTQNYQASSYEAETDAAKILSIVERGGLYGWYAGGDNVVDVELADPQLGYYKYWSYNNETGQSDELLVPALIFPIKERPLDPNFYRQNVVVPLVKSILDNYNQPPVILEKTSPAVVSQ